MNCSQVRKALYPEPEKCALTIEHSTAVAHVRECPECSRYFQEQKEWARTIKEKAGTDEAPRALRDRVVEAVHTGGQDKPLVRIRTRWWFAAAAAVFLTLPLVWLTVERRSEAFFRHVCEDHARYLAGSGEIQSSDPETVESWLRRETDYAVRVPVFQNAELLGGRLCFLRDKKAALVFYRKNGRPLSLFQFNEDGIDLRALDRSVIDGGPIWRGAFQGYNLAAFPQQDMIYVLVSDLRESELIELASRARLHSRGF